MKVLILTSNHYRHKYFANNVASTKDDVLVISEVQSHSIGREAVQSIGLGESVYTHFCNVHAAEQRLFSGCATFDSFNRFIPIALGELNLTVIDSVVRSFDADVAFVFGASWIREPLFSALPHNRTYNLHMGLSPFYRGHSTNFWAFWNREPQYVGATILSLDTKIDAGGILCHVRPKLLDVDDYYSFSMKSVIEATQASRKILEHLRHGVTPIAKSSVSTDTGRYYRSQDFTEELAARFLEEQLQLIEAFRNMPSEAWDVPDLEKLGIDRAHPERK